MGISLRLQEERKRIGLTQEAIAEKLDATKRSVINWEGGTALPGAEVLARYAAAGADVLYILTGQRSQPVAATASLPPRQRALLNSYELCTPEAQTQLVQLAALLAAGLPAGGGGGTVTQNIRAPVSGGVAGGSILRK